MSAPASLLRRLVRRTAPLLFPFMAAGCGCDLVGCVNGMRVQFDAPPAAPFRAELLVDGVVQPLPSGAQCAVGQSCEGALFFVTDHVGPAQLRVTTAAGVRTLALPPLRYRPVDIGECETCRVADVVVVLD